MSRHIQDGLKTRADLLLRVAESLSESIAQAAELIGSALEEGRMLFLCGNGGSAADSQHIAAELIGRFERERGAFPAVALSTDTSILTSVGNDYGFEHIFARQLQGLARPGDVLIGFSTSGNSANVIRAMQTARSKNVSTVAMTGARPGKMGELADVTVAVPESRTALVQEAHIAVGHLICELVETRLAG